jgi:hypothetical protein
LVRLMHLLLIDVSAIPAPREGRNTPGPRLRLEEG